MLEVYLRPIYQSLLVDPIARSVSRYSPMLITYLACLSGMMVAPALMYSHPALAIFFLILSGFLDTLDGTVARINHKVTEKGIIFDIISDRIVEVAVMIGLFAVDPIGRGALVLVMLASCYICVTSYLVVGVFSPNRAQPNFQYSPGIIERAEAFVFFLLMIYFPNHFSTLAYLFIGLTILTSYMYLSHFVKATYDERQSR